MHTQHLADRLSCGQRSEAFPSQPAVSHLIAYLFGVVSANVTRDCTQAIVTSEPEQAGQVRPVGFDKKDRSDRCPRASCFLPRWVLSQAFPLVAGIHSKKSSSWSTQSRSALSPSIQASTSNLSGRAQASVPVFPKVLALMRLRLNGGLVSLVRNRVSRRRLSCQLEDTPC